MRAGRRLSLRLLPWAAMLVAAVVVVVSRTGVVSASNRHGALPSTSASVGGTLVVDVPSVPVNLNPHTVAGDTAVTRAVGDAIWPQSYTVGPGLSPQLDTNLLSSAEVVSVSPQTVVYHIASQARWSDGQPIRAADFEYLWHEETLAALPPGGAGSAGASPSAGAPSAASSAGASSAASPSAGASSGGHARSVVSTTPGGAGVVAATTPAAPAKTGQAGTAAAAGTGVIGGVGYRDIQSVTGSQDGTTVTVVFRTPYADWPSLFDNLVPPQVATSAGWVQAFSAFDPTNLVSGGPWKVGAWVPGQRLVLVHNPDWWGTAPRLTSIVMQARPTTAAMAGDLAAGRAQLVQPSSFDLAALEAVSSAPTVRSETGLGTTMLQLVFNTAKAPFDQQAVRQAVGHLIDRAQLVRRLVQPLDPEVWVDDSFLYPNSQAGYQDDGSAYLAPHPAEAARLLAGAGIVPDASGTLTRAGAPVPLTLTWAAGDPWSALVGPAIAGQLVAAGFDVISNPVPSASLTGSVLPGGGWDLALVPVPGQAYTSQLVQAYSTAFGSTGADQVHDWSGFESAAVDSVFTQAASDLYAVSAAALYRQADQALWTALPALPLFAEPSLVAWSSDLTGVVADDGGAGVLWNLQAMAYSSGGSARTAAVRAPRTAVAVKR
ncbi:MAG: ABC transporter substrate-binding protein [Actinomycetota bacterium]|nr:ABC transporter substrate-binding protein [Actinomycetota bacterium]